MPALTGPSLSRSCCAPDFGAQPPPASLHWRRGCHRTVQGLVPAGSFEMGDGYGDGRVIDGEGFRHGVSLSSFNIDVHAVTNADFAVFVDDTGYTTDAERAGFSAVFHLALAADLEDQIGRAVGAPWWIGVAGADWRHPRGPLSDLDGIRDHPVVHVSWIDARAYARWAGRRLPTEAEWEYAARGGREGARFPWGDELLAEDGSWRCNIWQGDFPDRNTGSDGWVTTAPALTYESNGYGLYQMVGNVWEWCEDWFDANYYRRSPVNDPRGPNTGTARVIRGGSFLCHDSYCNRYRISARSSNTPAASTANTGFRTVAC